MVDNTDYKRIAADVRLGKGVKIFAFVNLYGCEIGDDSKIGTFVEIQRGAKIGRRVKVSSHTFLGQRFFERNEAKIAPVHGTDKRASDSLPGRAHFRIRR